MNFNILIALLTLFFVLQSEGRNDDENGSHKKIKVGIVGAGITGLYAALLLNELGIKYEILEASNRVGGRYFTYYFNNSDGTDYNYVDMGAMRYPVTPAFDIVIGRQNWSLVSYLNNRVKKDKKLKLIPFVMAHRNNIYYINGERQFRSVVDNCGKCFKFGKSDGGYVDDKFTQNTASFWEAKVFEYIKENYTKIGIPYLLQNDYQSMREFMMDPDGLNYDSEVIDWIETLDCETGRFAYSMMDVYLSDSLFLQDLLTIDGGFSKVINAMVSILRHKPKINHTVKAIDQLSCKELVVKTTQGSFRYTDLILTPTFSALRSIRYRFGLSLKKRIAMRTLNYAFSVKVALNFRTRFWENSTLMNGKPIFGGVSVTDLPIRQVIYPSYGINCTSCPGSLLASYVWSEDAKYFISLCEKEIADLILKDLAILHGPIVYKEYTGKFFVMNWMKYPYTKGAYCGFEPGDFESFFPHLIKPEAKGRVHFAGETITRYHGWTTGCLSSAFRAVKNILFEHKLFEKVKQLISKWGDVKDTANFDI